MKTLTVQGKVSMVKHSGLEELKGREKIQAYFYGIVGSVEHINIPKLEDAIRKEFNCKDGRFVQGQINLMQNEGKIRVESNVKVWIKQPSAGYVE
jgi:hypothetical protein